MMMDLMHVLGRGGAGNWGGNPPMSGPMPVRGTLATDPNPTMQAPQGPQSPFSVGSWLNWRHPNGGF